MPRIDSEPVFHQASLRSLLSQYDRRVQDALEDVTGSATGTERVKALYLLRRVVSAHDSVVVSTLCPLLEDLPGGSEVARRLRDGVEERTALLTRFQELSQGTEAHNVYPMYGAGIESIVAGLDKSFSEHVEDEMTRVGELLEAASASIEPEVIAARLAIESARAPGRAHGHHGSKAWRAFYRSADRVHDWNDSHHGWPSLPPRTTHRVRPRRTFTRRPPSVTDLLSGYDRTVDAIIAELARLETPGPERAATAYRLAAAIAVHDSILGGTVCRLLGAVTEGKETAAVLSAGCQERAGLLEEWNEAVRGVSPADLFESGAADAERIIAALVASFRVHETHETHDVSRVVEALQARSWGSRGTGLVSPYLLPDWPNPDPGILAAHMALWAERAPTHPHPRLQKHPASRVLRNLYRRSDQISDRRQARRGWPSLD